jgi:hypothetical protein
MVICVGVYIGVVALALVPIAVASIDRMGGVFGGFFIPYTVLIFGFVLASAICAGACLRPYFDAGRVESLWKQVVLFVVTGLGFLYLLWVVFTPRMF